LEAYVSISNDGMYYDSEAQFVYVDLACSQLTDCQACINQGACGWCASTVPGSYQSQSSCMSVPNQADHSVAAPTCNLTNHVWNYNCCDVCYQNNYCSGNGVCGCNQTCQCNSTKQTVYTNDNCSCECPLKLGQICNGHGTCNCNNTCTCDLNYNGTLCDCFQCIGNCFGNGACDCNNTCKCYTGFDIGTSCLCPLECQKDANGDQCSNNGNCNCGVCNCYEGYSGSICDCKDPSFCPTTIFGNECSGHGTCDCSGNCTCDSGWTGLDCSTPVPCDGKTCDNCSFSNDTNYPTKPFCLWCPATQLCEHVASPAAVCVLSANAKNGTTPKDIYQGGDSNVGCPQANVPINDDRNDNPSVAPIAAIVAAAVVVLIAVIAGIAFALRAKKDSGLLESEAFLSGDSSMAIKSPLYEPDTQMKTNDLYQGGEKNE